MRLFESPTFRAPLTRTSGPPASANAPNTRQRASFTRFTRLGGILAGRPLAPSRCASDRTTYTLAHSGQNLKTARHCQPPSPRRFSLYEDSPPRFVDSFARSEDTGTAPRPVGVITMTSPSHQPRAKEMRNSSSTGHALRDEFQHLVPRARDFIPPTHFSEEACYTPLLRNERGAWSLLASSELEPL